MRELDLKLLRWMRTHGHSPGLEGAAVALGKAGNNGLVWLVLGLAMRFTLYDAAFAALARIAAWSASTTSASSQLGTSRPPLL